MSSASFHPAILSVGLLPQGPKWWICVPHCGQHGRKKKKGQSTEGSRPSPKTFPHSPDLLLPWPALSHDFLHVKRRQGNVGVFFWLYPSMQKFLMPGIEFVPQQGPEPQQPQHWILNLLGHGATPGNVLLVDHSAVFYKIRVLLGKKKKMALGLGNSYSQQ